MIDSYYIQRARNGDQDAMDQLIRRYYDKIYTYCFHHVQEPQTAQDLCQETFIRMMAHIADYRHYGKFLNYLYTIAGNLCTDFYKKKQPMSYDMDASAKEKLQTDSDEEKVLLRALVDQLPPEFREAVILRFYQELRYQDIAKVLQISSSLARYRVKKALALLREELERSEYDG